MPTQIMDLWAVACNKSEDGVKLELVSQRHRWSMGTDSGAARLMEVEVPLPENNFTREELLLKAIETLREKKTQVMAEAQRELARLDIRINDLLRLTYQDNTPKTGELI